MLTGAGDVPTPSQFATSGDACLRSMDTDLARDGEDAQPGLRVPPCSEYLPNSVSGARCTPLIATSLLQPSLCGSTAASLRTALCLGDFALGMLCKDIPETVLGEVCEWGYADDEEIFTSILIFIDGSGTMTDSWPLQPRDAGWAIVVLGRSCSGFLRRIGESFGDVPISSDREDYIGCPRPTAAMGELTALFWALTSSCNVATRLRIDVFSDSEYAVGVVEGRTRARQATGLVHCAREMLQRARHLHRISTHHVSAHIGVAGNEVADALANTGRIRGPAPVCRVSPMHLNESARCSERPRRVIELHSSLFWEAIHSLPDPVVQPSLPQATSDPSVTSLVIATANVLTFHPQEEAQDVIWAPSARRAALARQIREVGVDILGIQEGRSRKDHFVVCEGYAMWISAATPGGSGGTELWISTNVCNHTQAIVSIRDASRLVVTCDIHGHTLDLCVLHAPSAHLPPRADEWWESTDTILRRVFKPARDRIVMIDANGRLGAAPTPLLGQTCRPDFDDNGYSLLEFMHHWDMEAPATFEPLPLTTWTSRGGKGHEIDFVLIPSVWHDLVKWNAVIPHVALALQGQEDHRLVATQVAFQPKHAVAVAPTAFYSRDALRSPEVIQKIRQFYDGVPAIPPSYDAAYAVDLFSKLARVVLASFAPRFAPGPRRPWITEQTWTILKQLLEARRTLFAEKRQSRRRLLCLTFSAWRRHRLDHRLRTFDYCHQSTLSDYRAAWAMWNERFFGAAARRASREDYQTWLVEQTDRISKAAESGDLRPFWSLVRTLKGKRRRLVSRPVLDQAGNPATDPSRIAELMAELFCTEFGHRVKTDQCKEVGLLRAFHGNQSLSDVPTVADVQAVLEPLCGQLKMGKATGPDCIPNEVLRGAGQNFLSTFADLVVRVLHEGAPTSWKGGLMTPVPKQAKKPMGQDNARGILLSSTLGKLYAKYLRTGATQHVQSAVLPTQLGGFPSKTIEFGNHLVFQRALAYRQKGVSSAVIFLDMTAAFYRALPEFVLGSLMEEDARAVLLNAPSFNMKPSDYISRIKAAICDWGAPPWLHRAIADWHAHSFFHVRHSEWTYRLVSGVRPGDPLADLIFNACMTSFIQELRECLIKEGLLVRMKNLDGNPLDQAETRDVQNQESEIDLDGPTWVDDHAIFTVARDPNDIVCNIRTIMVTLEAVAARHGFCLNTRKGKTECVITFAGKGIMDAKRALDWQEDHAQLNMETRAS